MRLLCFVDLALGALIFQASLSLYAQKDFTESQSTSNIFSVSIEQLKQMRVVGASRREQMVTEAPSAVTIITAEEIKRYGYRTLAEALQSARGLYITYNRSYSFLGIRGFNRGDYNDRILLLIDGHRINNNLSDGGFIGNEFLLDTDLIEAVEIIRGPGAALYGNNAFFGVVNVRTRRGRDTEDHGVELAASAASYDAYRGRTTYGYQFKNGLELLLSGTLFNSQGAKNLLFSNVDPLDPRPNQFIAENGDGETYKSAFGSLAFRDFTLTGAWFSREKGDPTAPDLTAFNDRRTQNTDNRSYVNLKYDCVFPEVVQVVAQVYYDRYDYTRDRLYDVPSIVLNRETGNGEWWGADLQLNKLLFDRHQISLGTEYRSDFRQDRRFFDVAPPSGTLGKVHRTTYNYGVYLNSDLVLFTNLHLNAGARYDQYGGVDATANPRTALIYSPLPKSTLKFLFGSAFRAPNFFERNLTDPLNPELNPETIHSYEMVYEQGIGDHLRSSISAFYNQIDDLITVPLGGYATNFDEAYARGVELELAGSWHDGVQSCISYALQQTEDCQTHQILTDSPKHLGKFRLSVPVYKRKIFASGEFQYTSSRTTLFGSKASGHGTVNLILFSQNLAKGFDISIGINNLFDRRYYHPSTAVPYHVQDLIEQDGRVFHLKMTYRF